MQSKLHVCMCVLLCVYVCASDGGGGGTDLELCMYREQTSVHQCHMQGYHWGCLLFTQQQREEREGEATFNRHFMYTYTLATLPIGLEFPYPLYTSYLWLPYQVHSLYTSTCTPLNCLSYIVPALNLFTLTLYHLPPLPITLPQPH